MILTEGDVDDLSSFPSGEPDPSSGPLGHLVSYLIPAIQMRLGSPAHGDGWIHQPGKRQSEPRVS